MSSAKLKKPNKTIWLNVLQRIKTFLVKTFFVARLDDARPTFFLWLPCVWGILLARPSIDKGGVFYMLIFAVMCLMMYSSGCIVNDIIDRDIDRLIPRTANRLLAARQYNLFVAALIAFILAMVSLKILLLFFNGLAITIAITGAAGIIIYPFAKQYTHKTQFVLGFVSNIGVLVAYAGCNNTISIGVVAMYIGSVYWTCVYDTMYGYQDKEHDIKIGVKSLAVLYGSEIKNRLKSFATTAFGCFIAAGILEKPRLGLGYYVFILLSYILLLKVITKTNLEEPKECYRALMTNTAIGFIIAFACYAGRAF